MSSSKRDLTGGKSHIICFEAGHEKAEVKLKTEDLRIICPEFAPPDLKILPKPEISNDIRRFVVAKETKRKLNSPQVRKPEKLMKHLTPQKLGDVSQKLEEEVALGIDSICDILEKSSLEDDIGIPEEDSEDAEELFNLNRLANKNTENKENCTAKKKLALKYNFSDSD